MENEFPTMVSKIFDLIDTIELFDNIRKFRRLDLRYESDSVILSHLRKIIPIKLVITSKYLAGTELYRIRKLPDNNQRFLDKKDLLYPPKEIVKDMGRLNNPHESLFYTSPTTLNLLNEVKVNKNQEFSLIKYKVRKGGFLNIALIGVYDFEHHQNERLAFDDIKKHLTTKARINYDIIYDFLSNEFSRDVGIGTEFLYRVSTLIVKHFFDLPDIDGFLYPSIASKKGNNLALKPQAVDRCIDIVGLKIFKLIGEYENGTRANTLSGVWSNEIVNDKIIYRPSSEDDDLDLLGIGSEHWYGPLPTSI